MASATGLTLTEASTIVFAELTWTPSILNQAEDRAHRIGQKNSVNIYYMLGHGTVDDQIFQMINSKAMVTTDVTDGCKTSMNIKEAQFGEIEFECNGGVPFQPPEEEDKKAPLPKQKTLDSFFSKDNSGNPKPEEESKNKPPP